MNKVNVVKNIFASCILATTLMACAESTKKVSKVDPMRMPEGEKDYKKSAMIHVEMAEKYLAMGQVARAKQKIIHALEIQPDMPEVHNAFGYFLQTVSENVEAEKHYKQAIKLSNKKAKYYSNYGSFLCGLGRYKDADTAFLKAVSDKTYTKTAEVYENAGICALRAGDKIKSKKYFDLATKHDPQKSKSILALADLYYQENNLKAASLY